MNADKRTSDAKRRIFDKKIRTIFPWRGVSFMRVIRSTAGAVRVVFSAACERQQTSQTNHLRISACAQ